MVDTIIVGLHLATGSDPIIPDENKAVLPWLGAPF